MKKNFLNVPLRTLLLCWLCVMVLCFSLLFSAETNNFRRQQNAYNQLLSETSQNIFKRTSADFKRAVDTATSIVNTRWYSLLMSMGDLYKSEFTQLDCAEYLNQHKRLVSYLDFVHDILVIVPQNDIVVSSRGWMSLHTFDIAYGRETTIHATAGVNADPEITLTNDNLFSYRIKSLYTRPKQRAIYILFDKKELSKYMQTLLSQKHLYARLDFGESTVWETGKALEDELFFTYSSAYPGFSLTMNFETYFRAYRNDWLYRMVTESLILLFVSFLLALLIIKLAWLPILRAFRHEGFSSEKYPGNPFDALNTIFTSNKEFQNRNARITRYITNLQSEILYGVLSNPENPLDITSVQEAIPWISANYPYLMTITLNAEAEASSLAAHKISVLLPDAVCTVLWFTNMDDANEEKLALYRRENALSISAIETDHTRMQQAFTMLYDEFRMEYMIQHELPLEVLYEFYGDIIAGKEKECLDLISNMRLHCEPDAIVHHVARFARENGVACEMLDGTWDGILKCVQEVCHTVSDSHLVSSCHSAAALCEYIDENFSNPDMGVKLLCDQFGIGRTLISQLIKTQTGETFTDYLTNLRMSKACELLLTENNVSSVGEKIGYLNYSTFKRAFIRKFGISPRQWRDGHGGQSGEQKSEETASEEN